jgi:hypothetical protein
MDQVKDFRKPSFARWRIFLKVLYGIPLDAAESAVATRHLGFSPACNRRYADAVAMVGRRGGKSLITALVICYNAVFMDWLPYLAVGEHALVLVIAENLRQSKNLFRVVRGLLRATPLLGKHVVKVRHDEILLDNRVIIRTSPPDYRSVRGFTLVTAVLDEAAFYAQEGAIPDVELYAALKPATLTVPGAMIITISSPFTPRGLLYDTHRRCYGQPDADTLVWVGTTREMNPTVPLKEIEKEVKKDPTRARAEYFAEFRSELGGYVSRDVVEAAVVRHRRARSYVDGWRYHAYVDMSGGVNDAHVCAIAHVEDNIACLDQVMALSPAVTTPAHAVQEFAAMLRRYRLTQVTGDRYAGEWPAEEFRKHGCDYRVAAYSRSEYYLELLPMLTSQAVQLLDEPVLIDQLCGLLRYPARGKSDTVDHQRGGHDDVANACAGALVEALKATGNDIYGVIEDMQRLSQPWYKEKRRLLQVKFDATLLRLAEKVNRARATRQGELAPMHAADGCPRCGSICVVTLGSQTPMHCNECGNNWGSPKLATQGPMSRGDWLRQHGGRS